MNAKTTWSWMPWNALRAVAEVVTRGGMKHPPMGYLDRSAHEHFDALLRHLSAWRTGELTDPESGRSHLVHVAARALMMLERELRQGGEIR